MLSDIGHIRRLIEIGRTLARHDSLILPEGFDLPPAVVLLVRWARRMWGPGGFRQASGRPGERLAAAFYELGPTFIKLGQALSVRPDLVGEALAADLGRLRDRLPPEPAATARQEVERELKRPLEALFQDFDETAVAAASVAQVHFAVTAEGEPVAVKILRPGIEQRFRTDLDLFYWLAGHAERRLVRLRRLRPVQVVDTVAESVRMETDLRLEAAAASELAGNFTEDPDLRVPRVDWVRTSRRVLTLARVEGIPIDDVEALRAAGHDLPALAARAIRVFLKQALRDGFFHADLHQGNLFVAADGALEPVDFGIMGRLDRATRRFMAEMLLAFISGDWRRAAEVHFAAGYVPADKSVDAFAQACRSIGEPIMGRPVQEISIGRLLAQLFEVTELFGMQTQPQLLLLQKTMVTVEGVARSLDPGVNFWTVSQPVIEGWMQSAMGPEAQMRDAAGRAQDMLHKLPAMIDRFERASRHWAEGRLRLDDDSIRRLADAQARRRRPLVYAAWAAVAAVVLALLF